MNVTSQIVPWRGTVLDIHTAPTGGASMVVADEVSAIAGRGLEGDRYCKETGFYSWFSGPIRHISLIEWEVLEALKDCHNLPLEPGVTRRHIVTRGVPLGHLLNLIERRPGKGLPPARQSLSQSSWAGYDDPLTAAPERRSAAS